MVYIFTLVCSVLLTDLDKMSVALSNTMQKSWATPYFLYFFQGASNSSQDFLKGFKRFLFDFFFHSFSVKNKRRSFSPKTVSAVSGSHVLAKQEKNPAELINLMFVKAISEMVSMEDWLSRRLRKAGKADKPKALGIITQKIGLKNQWQQWWVMSPGLKFLLQTYFDNSFISNYWPHSSTFLTERVWDQFDRAIKHS